MVNALHWLEHVRHGFDNLKVAISMSKTKVRRWGIAGVAGWWLNSNNAIINNDSFESRSDWKMTGIGQETQQSGFITQQCPVSRIKTGERHLEIAWMGHPSTPAVILWPGGIWLSPLWINGTWACRAALQQFRRTWKMTQRMFCRKTKTVFLARYS